MNALALALVVAAAAPTAGDVEIAAAQAEAEAFVALKQQRDCDAFLRAHTQLAKDTFLTNAGLVLERAAMQRRRASCSPTQLSMVARAQRRWR